MGDFAEIIEKYQPYISQIFGNTDDIRAKNSYKAALKDLDALDEEKNKIERIPVLLKSLRNAQLSDAEKYKTSEQFNTGVENYDAALKGTNAYGTYEKYLGEVTGMNEKQGAQGIQQPLPFEKYVEQNPNLKDELFSQNILLKVQNPIPQEEQDKLLFQKAGFNEDDIGLYNKYKDQVNMQKDYNNRLLEMIYRNQPALTSTGALGNTLGKQFGDMASLKQLTEPPKLETKFDTDSGEMLQWDPNDPLGTLQSYQYKDKKVEEPKFNEDNIKEVDGKYYFYANVWNPKTGKYEEQITKELNPTELDDYKLGYDKKRNQGIFTPKKTGIGRGRGRGGTWSASKLTPAQLKELTPEQLSTMNAGQLNQLREMKKMLSPETQTALDSITGSEVSEEDLFGGKGEDKPTSKEYNSNMYGEDETDVPIDPDITSGIDQTMQEFINDLKTEKDPTTRQQIIDEVYQWMTDNLWQAGIPRELTDDYYKIIDNLVAGR